MKIAFYGSSLLSSYWNGAATYYRGLLRDLAGRGYDITFYEPDAFDRQQHKDMEPPEWARVVVYDATPDALASVLSEAAAADIVVKASGVGVFDTELLDGIIAHARPGALKLFWDVDAAATLEEMRGQEDHVVRRCLPELDMVLTYGGGPPVIGAYEGFGAARCVPVYNACDPTTHHPVEADPDFAADLAFLGNRLPDREARVEEFFLKAAGALPGRSFLIGGNGWETKGMPANVRHLGHVYTHQHNAFNCTPLAVLNVARDSMANIGFSPATRVFEAAGAAACLITDAWEGIEQFLKPDEEVLVARDGQAGCASSTSRPRRGQAAVALPRPPIVGRGREVARLSVGTTRVRCDDGCASACARLGRPAGGLGRGRLVNAATPSRWPRVAQRQRADAARVAARVRFRGTSEGDAAGHPSTAARVDLPVATKILFRARRLAGRAPLRCAARSDLLAPRGSRMNIREDPHGALLRLRCIRLVRGDRVDGALRVRQRHRGRPGRPAPTGAAVPGGALAPDRSHLSVDVPAVRRRRPRLRAAARRPARAPVVAARADVDRADLRRRVHQRRAAATPDRPLPLGLQLRALQPPRAHPLRYTPVWFMFGLLLERMHDTLDRIVLV
jgi:spore maturation protein CgeB